MTFRIVLFSLLMTAMSSCKFVKYGFNGSSIPPDVNTISIALFPVQGQNAAIAPPTYSQDFTEALRNIFLQQSRLELSSGDADLIMEGEIVNYQVKTASVSNNQAETENLTISIKVRYTDVKHPENSFEQTFTQMLPYAAGTNLSSVEPTLLPQLNEMLTQDIFNKALGNW